MLNRAVVLNQAEGDAKALATCEGVGKECFPAGTLVLMADGSAKPIEDVVEGDRVMSRPSQGSPDQPPVPSRVVHPQVHDVTHVVTQTLRAPDGRAGQVTSTEEHPFYVTTSDGWVGAKRIVPGQRLAGIAQPWFVLSAEVRAQSVRVYNFEVEGTHTYFIGANINPTGPPVGWVWVHNMCDAPRVIEAAVQDVSKALPGSISGLQLVDKVINASAELAKGTLDVAGSAEEVAKNLSDLAKYRADLGLPVAGSLADKSTIAKLIIGGKQYFGINAHGQKVTLRVNSISKTHAEADAFQQAFNSGARSGVAVLFVDRDLCLACGRNGGVVGMAKQLGIRTLQIYTPSKRITLTIEGI